MPDRPSFVIMLLTATCCVLASLAQDRPNAAAATAPHIVTPEPRQIAWQEMEFIAFVHFGMNTFTDREWGDGTEDPKIFNPTQFDARQWARVLKDAGMRQVILTAKHHDGFCLWPSRFTEHSVSSSPWKQGRGDVVREVADACRAEGLKFGVYLSPWDRHEPGYGDSPRYNEHYRNQLAELLTNYGPIREVWFDGGCGEGPNGRKQVYDWPSYIDVIRRLAPDAVIFSDAGPDVRWVGNEAGFAGETNWSMLRRDEFYPGTPNYRQLTEGHENGTHWVPAECDVSIRPGWFYHSAEDDKVKSLAQLLDIYYGSVGRNGVLLLNVPADTRGLIHENDVARLKELREVLDETFRTNLAQGKWVTPVSPSTMDFGGSPPTRKVTDGDSHTSWAFSGNYYDRLCWLCVDLGAEVAFDRIWIQEDIRGGQRVRRFAVEVPVDAEPEGWKTVAEGTTIGCKRLLRIPKVTASVVKLLVRDARAAPAISEIGVYLASPREQSR
jgi:alpha-L-fucosidase